MSDKKIALVTGANQGIGFEISKALVANNYIVFVGSRNVDNGTKAAEKLGENAHAIQLDVTDQTSIKNAVTQNQNEYGKLDLLVNNAAISHAGKPGRKLEEMIQSSRASVVDIDEVKAVWETNVFGVIAVTQAMLPLLKNATTARIVNVSSGVGSLALTAEPNHRYRQGFTLPYSASKTALNAVTLGFAIDLEQFNIKVIAVSPGFTATALNNFQGTETVEEGARAPVKVALEENFTSGTFVGPNGIIPW